MKTIDRALPEKSARAVEQVIKEAHPEFVNIRNSIDHKSTGYLERIKEAKQRLNERGMHLSPLNRWESFLFPWSKSNFIQVKKNPCE